MKDFQVISLLHLIAVSEASFDGLNVYFLTKKKAISFDLEVYRHGLDFVKFLLMSENQKSVVTYHSRFSALKVFPS